MTSTVLDVTVLLLCVSASVVALGGVGGSVGTDEPTAGDVADRLATETVTATYEAPEAPGGEQTIHATRAELLAVLAVADGKSDDDANSERYAAFESSARSVVREGLGPRVRIDVRALAPTATAAGEGATDPFATGPAWRAVNETGTASWPTTAGGTPWSVALGGSAPTGGGAVERGETVWSEIAVGPSPPRTADTTTAVVDHPAPGDTEGIESVRIAVRRW